MEVPLHESRRSPLRSLARNLLRKPAVESELDQELQSYAETITEEKIAAGMSPAEARRTTLADIGGIEQVKQSVRDRRTGTGLELLWQDVRYALRQLAHNRAFTLTAVLTLGLGIGATTAIFSAVYALLLRPLPYPDADRLMFMLGENSDPHLRPRSRSQDFVAATNKHEILRAVRGLLHYYNPKPHRPGRTLRVASANVTANFLPDARSRSAARAPLHPQDKTVPTGPLVVILSNHLWRTYFHADPADRRKVTFTSTASN